MARAIECSTLISCSEQVRWLNSSQVALGPASGGKVPAPVRLCAFAKQMWPALSIAAAEKRSRRSSSQTRPGRHGRSRSRGALWGQNREETLNCVRNLSSQICK